MKIQLSLFSLLILGGCITTEEMQLAPNIVRLDTQARGALFVGNAGNVTLQRAAKVTLANGYDYFRLDNAQMGHTSEFAGIATTGNASVYGYGNMATASGSSFSTPIYQRTSEIGVTVVMFHTGEAGAKDAFDARAVIAKLGE